MSILHMETEIAHNTQRTIVNEYQEIVSNLQTATTAINDLRSNWQGDAASQFLQEYDQWNGVMNRLLEEFSKMGSQLAAEIAEWEQTASQFE